MSTSVFDDPYGFKWKKNWRGRYVTKSVPGYTLVAWVRPIAFTFPTLYRSRISINGKVVEDVRTHDGLVGLKAQASHMLQYHIQKSLDAFQRKPNA